MAVKGSKPSETIVSYPFLGLLFRPVDVMRMQKLVRLMAAGLAKELLIQLLYRRVLVRLSYRCLLYTSDAADEL